ncbi:MAG: hypothetical protein HZB13_06920 [Acidobacteria bacterium]|nr:hypothetical protein [Acidobacteriota bacterium]
MKNLLLLTILLAAIACASPIEGVTLQDPPLFVPSPPGPWLQKDLGNGLHWEGAAPGQFDWDLRMVALPSQRGFFLEPPPTETPEPASTLLTAAGLIALSAIGFRRIKNA